MFFVLPFFELLPVLLLMGVQLLFLLLIFLVRFGVPAARWGRALDRRQIVRMCCIRATCIASAAGRVLRSTMDLTSLSGRHGSVFLQFSRFGSRSDRRLAPISRGSQLRIRPRLLHLSSLIGDGINTALVGRPFFFRCGPIVKATTSTVIANPGHVALVDGRLIDVV